MHRTVMSKTFHRVSRRTHDRLTQRIEGCIDQYRTGAPCQLHHATIWLSAAQFPATQLARNVRC